MSSKTSSGPSKTRSSTSRTRKTPSPRTKTAKAEAETGTEPLSDEDVKADSTPTPPKKTTTRRRTTATSRKKAVTPAETESGADASIEAEAATETPKRKTPTRRRTTKATAAEETILADGPEKKPAKRTRRKTVSADEAPTTTDDGEAKAKPTTRKRTTRAKAKPVASEPEVTDADEAPVPKTQRTRRKKAVESKTTAPADEAIADGDSTTPKTKPRTTTRKRASTRNTKSADANKPAEQTETQPVTASSSQHKDTPHHEDAEQEGRPRFQDLALSAPILKAVEAMGYTHPTPIQALATPAILAGRDVLGVAQTGTGKTASFTLPLLEKLSKSRARARMPRSLILEPTRELALQVAENFKLYGAHLRLTHALLIGGGKLNEQRDILNRGVDVLIATPGRLLDMFDRGGLLLTQTDTLVIDEADRMLDMGFIPDIERIVSLLPRQRQTLFFSATMAPEIRHLADNFLNNPKEITIARQSSVASTITEGLLIVEKRDKNRAISALLRHDDVQNAIIFCNRKRDVDSLEHYLTKQKFSVGHLHGDLAQDVRFETLERFRSGELSILVCSDVAARGIDIGGLSHVVNYDLPFNAEDYVHRIGRTGRAGKEGIAYSLATPDEQKLLAAVEALTGKKIEAIEVEDFPSLQWRGEDEAKPSHKKDGAKNTRQGRNKRAPEAKTDEQPTPPKKQASRALLPEARKHDHKRSGRAELLPPVPETNGMQDGFGENVPAFMKVSYLPEPHEPSDS